MKIRQTEAEKPEKRVLLNTESRDNLSFCFASSSRVAAATNPLIPAVITELRNDGEELTWFSRISKSSLGTFGLHHLLIELKQSRNLVIHDLSQSETFAIPLDELPPEKYSSRSCSLSLRLILFPLRYRRRRRRRRRRPRGH